MVQFLLGRSSAAVVRCTVGRGFEPFERLVETKGNWKGPPLPRRLITQTGCSAESNVSLGIGPERRMDANAKRIYRLALWVSIDRISHLQQILQIGVENNIQ